jgi:hypothetical protein
MVSTTCPACGKAIATDDINIREGVGLCRACGKLSRLGEIADQPSVDVSALTTPPAGCSYEEPFVGGMVVRASLRSSGAAIGVFAACVFWNGIVSVFVLVAIAGLYTNLVGPLPTWFPAPSNSGRHGNMGPDMPLGMTLFLCIFLLPFIAVGLGLLLTFLTCLMGRVEIVVAGNDGRVRTGFGPFNWTRRFDASRVTQVSSGQTSYEQNGQRKPLIQIEAERTVKFGSTLPDERRAWVLGVLRLLLVKPGGGARTQYGVPPMARG